jgi:hypothetical protein
MRYFIPLLVALALPAQAAPPVPCEGRSLGYGSAELVCAVAPGAAPGLLTFTARFAGVHDDSQAGLAASLDAAPLACLEGSRTRIAGDEDGDTLTCQFMLAAETRAVRRVNVHLLWFHAEPVAFNLSRE